MSLPRWWDELWIRQLYRMSRIYRERVNKAQRELARTNDYLMIESDRVEYLWQQTQRMQAQRDIAVRHLAGKLPADIDAYLSTLTDD